ncbi:SRPBCC family protein [Sneathiella sp. CAU 1612]|uniref:SRPBCC family protein n=1 Tax=Sneathiella sedimenti TaxID=2816034 RepID=A0ABS3F420_9PROT|nr:SRPBCC family protein [Sneathiella sedimenti]MBO0333260.1 SRPBCC family protein [Sneathiella sedimenti]
MVSVRRSTVIEAPIEAVWEILRDFNGHDRWHPAVRRSHLDGGKRTDQVSAVRNFELTAGEHLREQLLSMSDADHSFQYAIVESDIPLQNYIAEVSLRPVTDGNRTFWSWTSKFETPKGREQELAKLVAEGVYEAGFEAVRTRLTKSRPLSQQSFKSSQQSMAAANSAAISGMAVGINRYGGPEELHPIEVRAEAPGPGEVRLRQTAIGVNYIDVYCRSGYFDLLKPPGVPGMEAVGIVESVGEGVRHLSPGQRVGYACPPVGAYASVRTMWADLVIPIPDDIDDVKAAAGLLKGMAAEFLLHRVHQVKKGDNVLVYAPAGGIGRILCQWANSIGATVIGATSSEEKARIARAAGAHHVVLPGPQSLEEQVMKITKGHGADVIYDAVGKDSFDHSVAALATCGHLISFGQASGDIGARDISSLASKSATVSRPNFGHYTDTRKKVIGITNRLFDAIKRHIISIEVGQQYPLSRAADAHRALEGRETTGSSVLIPDDYQKGK